MLDDYVAFHSIFVQRDEQGCFRLLRSYRFEFSSTGNERYNGTITLAGRQPCKIQLEPYRIIEIDESTRAPDL